MKKLFYLFMVAMCATMFLACSDDDDKDPLKEEEEGKEGVITMTTEETEISIFYAETFKEGEIITIDWGDGDMEEFKSVGIYEDWDEDEIHYVLSTDYGVEHEYSNKNPHIVTIKGNIKVLDCWGNNLTSLNVSKNTKLTGLSCENNNLTSLDISKNTALTWLECSWNYNMTSLNVSGCTALTKLTCEGNKLTSLDISGCTALTELTCEGNKLTSLDISKNTKLTQLYCDGNKLTSLNVSGCTALTELDCGSNNLTSAALNQIFRDLPQGKKLEDYPYQSEIRIYGNPGDDTCDKSIAEKKGWIVR